MAIGTRSEKHRTNIIFAIEAYVDEENKFIRRKNCCSKFVENFSFSKLFSSGR